MITFIIYADSTSNILSNDDKEHVLDLVKKGHPNAKQKIGSGVQDIVVCFVMPYSILSCNIHFITVRGLQFQNVMK